MATVIMETLDPNCMYCLEVCRESVMSLRILVYSTQSSTRSFYRQGQWSQSFQFAAPTVWNSIPQNIRLSLFIGSFKRSLKTRVFSATSVFWHSGALQIWLLLYDYYSWLAMFSTSLHQRLWLKFAWICELYKYCNNNNNTNNIMNPQLLSLVQYYVPSRPEY